MHTHMNQVPVLWVRKAWAKIKVFTIHLKQWMVDATFMEEGWTFHKMGATAENSHFGVTAL